MTPDVLADRDGRTSALLRTSRLGWMTRTALRLVLASWRDSHTGQLAARVNRLLHDVSWADRLRLGGVLMVAASATVLVVQPVSSSPAPLTWIVPAIALATGVGLLAIARGSQDPHR